MHRAHRKLFDVAASLRRTKVIVRVIFNLNQISKVIMVHQQDAPIILGVPPKDPRKLFDVAASLRRTKVIMRMIFNLNQISKVTMVHQQGAPISPGVFVVSTVYRQFQCKEMMDQGSHLSANDKRPCLYAQCE